ncbi:hypothetical protein BDZ94DRAFT_1239542 [Collybia nuda]|uniref:Protein F37C4.5 n=1 Tax=Collybia nuda TaxID=64659 RepID=A0A9P5Y0F5_9AGAR|nr:hypothetical protein BDZ94DRAFT_1239542 [Collybia nuda]
MTSPLTFSAPDHPIKSVTVFKSYKAEVVRTFTVDLSAGQKKVIIKDLPSTIDTQTVRVSGVGGAHLLDVVCTIANDKDALYAPESSLEIIRHLSLKKQDLENEKRVRGHEAELLVNYAKTLNGEHVTPPQMTQFLESFIELGRKNLDAVGEISEKIVEIERQIDRETRKGLVKKGGTRGEVAVVLGADENTTIDLKLTYIVSHVHWKPIYELHATTENGNPSSSVSLHYRARVTQSTGEDWSNTSLTLSTITADTMVKKIPGLTPIKIKPHSGNNNLNLGRKLDSRRVTQSHQLANNPEAARKLRPVPTGFAPQPQSRGIPTSNTNPFAVGSSATLIPLDMVFDEVETEDFEDFEDVTQPTPVTEPATVVAETPISISYSVHGESTIPSDGIEHQVSMAVLLFEAKISYVTIPRIEPLVYLKCQVKNTSEYRLLPGPVSVILDDSHASNTFIGDVNIGDDFDCTLGDDTATKVTYIRTSHSAKVDGGSFSEDKKTVTYNTQITIHNKHTFTIPDLIICDVVPTSDDKRAKVILRKPEGLADANAGEVVTDTERDGLQVMWSKQADGKGGKKEGKFEWKWCVAAGVKVTLESQWEIKAPGDVIWAEVAA